MNPNVFLTAVGEYLDRLGSFGNWSMKKENPEFKPALLHLKFDLVSVPVQYIGVNAVHFNCIATSVGYS